MAYADTSTFGPSESMYTQPGEYETTQKNVALEKASYLSSMDMYYEDLEEKQRQFDLSLDFEKEKWGEQLGFMQEEQAFEEEQWGQQYGLAQEQQEFEQEAWELEFAESQEQFDVMADLQQQQINLMGEQQAHSEQQDWIGNIFGAVGAADVIGGWFNS